MHLSQKRLHEYIIKTQNSHQNEFSQNKISLSILHVGNTLKRAFSPLRMVTTDFAMAGHR